MADLLQQVLPPALSSAYRSGFGQLEGYVVRAADVVGARSPAEVVEAFGYGGVAGAYSPDPKYVDVLRFTVAPLSRLETAYGSDDPTRVSAEGSIVDKPPFRGNGFTASTRVVVPQWRLSRDRVAPGSELHRLHRDGRDELLGGYRDVATGWDGPGIAADAANALPAHLVGMRARWNGAVYLADLLDDGTVALAALGETAPPGFEHTRPRLSRRVVARTEVEALDAIVTNCRWRGQPFEVTGQSDGWCRLSYAGRNSWTAEALQLELLQPGVYEATVSRGELTDVSGVQLELPAPTAPPPPDPDPTPTAAHPDIPVPDEWASFAEGLRATLRDLDGRTYLIITWTKANVFVQYAQGEDTFRAEAVADEYAPEERELTVAQVGEMTDLGWTPPTVDPAGRFNWSIDLPWPAGSAAYRHVAAASVAALRIRGVPGPDELTYQAWREPQRPPGGVTFYEEDLDRGEPNLQLPALGIPRTAS